MNRILFTLLFLLHPYFSVGQDIQIYVSPTGNDLEEGLEIDFPKKTIKSALEQIQKYRKTSEENVQLILLPGDYYLANTITLGPETGSVSIEALLPGTVTVKGSKVI
ncbi:MAG: hypothetical protein KAQ62_28580, partial [Cyclobacteriaceae bacterium]|nr:hypothetical protein [Cyclobacteriaceae bacterium]